MSLPSFFLSFPFPPPSSSRPFKLLCKKCSLIGVCACVLPRLRECLSGGNDSWLAPPRCAGGALLHPPDSPEACPRPPASRSEIVHRNLLKMPRPHHHPVQLSPPLCGGGSQESLRAFLWPFYLGLLCPLSRSLVAAAATTTATTDVVPRL